MNKKIYGKFTPLIKRRYNLCYRARKKGYRIITTERIMYRPAEIDEKIERALNEFGFYVQTTIFQ